MSSDNEYFEKRGGVWKRIFKDSGGVEHVLDVSPQDTEELEAQANPPTHKTSSGELKRIFREALDEHSLQDVKDRASARDIKVGGGVVGLQSRDISPPSEATLHREVSDELDKLRRLEEKGDRVSSQRLNEMYSIAMRKIKNDKNFRLLRARAHRRVARLKLSRLVSS